MVSIFLCVALQSKNLNPGPYGNYSGRDAVPLWLPLVTQDASFDYALTLGTTDHELRALRNRVGHRVVQSDLDHVSGTPLETVAKNVQKAVRQALAPNSVKPGSPLDTFLIAEGLVDWVRSHVEYDTMLEPGKVAASAGISLDEERKFRSQFWTPKSLLEKRELCAVCAGFSRLTHHMARSLGVPLYNVRGYTRGALQVNGTHTTNAVNHSWNLLVLNCANGKRLLIPADPTQSRIGLSNARATGFDWTSPYSFPNTADDVAFFHYTQYFTDIEDFPQKIAEYQPLRLSELQWREMGSVAVMDRYRVQVLRSTQTATTNRVPD